MGSDSPLLDVKRGDSVRKVISSVGDTNAVRRLVRERGKGPVPLEGPGDETPRILRSSSRIRAKNDSTTDVGRYEFVSLEDVLYKESDREAEFKDNPTLLAIALAEDKAFGITTDLFPGGSLRDVVVDGVFTGLVSIDSTSDGWADIESGVMTSNADGGPIRILSVPEGTGDQYCTVQFVAEGSAAVGYTGPFQIVEEYDEDLEEWTFTVGPDRAFYSDILDQITIHQDNNRVVRIDFSSPDSITISKAALGSTLTHFFFYELVRTAADTWTASFLHRSSTSGLFPAADQNHADHLFFVVGQKRRIQASIPPFSDPYRAIEQIQFGQPTLYTAPGLRYWEVTAYGLQSSGITLAWNKGPVMGIRSNGAWSGFIGAGSLALSPGSYGSLMIDIEYDSVADTLGVSKPMYFRPGWFSGTIFTTVTNGYEYQVVVAELSTDGLRQVQDGHLTIPGGYVGYVKCGVGDKMEPLPSKLTWHSTYDPTKHQQVFAETISDGDGSLSIRLFTDKNQGGGSGS